MPAESTAITPASKVGELLDRFPHLEQVLISLSPTYQALRNPVLRRTVAKVATLRQVAAVGDVPLGKLVDTLREAVGQMPLGAEASDAAPRTRPAWADTAAVTRSHDARATIAAGGHPMPQVMADLATLGAEDVYALVTPFVPAPLIDLAREKGFESWAEREAPELVRTCFRRSSSSPLAPPRGEEDG